MRESKKPIKVVLGCGSNCGGHDFPGVTELHNKIHPPENYHTVDKRVESHPSINGDLREESTLDQIRNLGKIDVLISEVINFGTFTPNNAKKLSEMLASDGIFISQGETFHLKDTTGYFLFPPISLFTKIQTKSRGLDVLDKIASEDFLIQSFAEFNGKAMSGLRLVIDKIKTLELSHSDKNPLVLSLVAQLDTYNELRKKRFFRNYFMDATYETELRKLREELLSLDNVDSTSLCALLEETEAKLPSSKKPSHLRLSDILDAFKNEIISRNHDALRVAQTTAPGIANTRIATEAVKLPNSSIKELTTTSDTARTSKASR